MGSQTKILHSFHRALDSYNEHAIVQRDSAANLVMHLLNSGCKPSLNRVFEFGCGTGFLTEHLTRQFKINEFIANDLVQDCQAYLPKPEIQFIAGDVDDIAIPDQSDLICSASCVQWCEDLPRLLNKLAKAIRDDGFLAISSYSTGHFKELVTLQNATNTDRQELNYWTEQTWKEHLESYYVVKNISSEESIIWFNSVREMLLHLRLTGVNGIAGQTWNQQNLKNFENSYRENFEVDGKVPLTYKPIYIIARKQT